MSDPITLDAITAANNNTVPAPAAVPTPVPAQAVTPVPQPQQQAVAPAPAPAPVATMPAPATPAISLTDLTSQANTALTTVNPAAQSLVATLKETVQIQEKGRADRAAAEGKMRQIESDLKQALIANAQRMR